MQRRTLLAHCASSAALALLPQGSHAAEVSHPIVDTHTHFYDPRREQGVPWPGKESPLYRAVYPRDWQKVAEPCGVTHTIVVEASSWLEDNQWILDLAAPEKCIVGFIGRLSPFDDDFSAHLKRFAANPLFLGLRFGNEVLQRADDAALHRALTLLADRNLTLDLNGAKIYEPAAKLAERYPALRIVIDHIGSAGDAAKLKEEWRRGMGVLGKYSHVYCKVSALLEQTEASSQKYGNAPRDATYYRPVLDHCWETFGADRLVYGSNWPVCEKGGSYADQFEIVRSYFADHPAADRTAFFHDNSRVAYRWSERK